MLKHYKKLKGFTLIELLVVATIIIILIAISAISYEKSRAQARDTKRASDLSNVVSSLRMYFARYGYYPISDDPGSTCSFFSGSECLGQLVPDYFEKLPTDPNYKSGETKYVYTYAPNPNDSTVLKPSNYIVVRANMENFSAAGSSYTDNTDMTCTPDSEDSTKFYYCLKLKY